MRIKTRAFKKLAKDEAYENGCQFLRSFNAGKHTWYFLAKRKNQIGYELVKQIYNSLGEDKTLQIINFGEETIDGFKSKYIQIGNKLY